MAVKFTDEDALAVQVRVAAAELGRRLRLVERYEAALREIAELPHVDAGYGPGIAIDALADPEYVDVEAVLGDG